MNDYLEQLQFLLFSEDESNLELAMELVKSLEIDAWPLYHDLRKCSEFFNQHFRTAPNVKTLLRFLHNQKGLLNFKGKKLQHLPTYLSALGGLVRYLDLSQNLFTHIPDCIFSFYNLNTLLLNQNAISELPNSLFSLINLETLSFLDSFVYEIPNQISQLKYLKKIAFGNTQKTAIDVGIGFSKLDCLETVIFSSYFDYKNQAVFDPQIFTLANVRNFQLWGSSFIPAEILNFQLLETLILPHCKQLDLTILQQFKHLKTIFISRLLTQRVTEIRQALPTVQVNFDLYY
jgi:hypothetical protein